MGAEKTLMGLQLVGTFGGVDRSKAVPALLVDFEYRDNEGKRATATRRAEFSAHDSNNGELTRVGKIALDLEERWGLEVAGTERIAVAVWINARGQRLTYRAQDVVLLDESDGLHALPADAIA